MHGAVGLQSFLDPEDPVAGDKRLRAGREQAIGFWHAEARHFQHVGEVLGGEERHGRTLPLDHGVDADRGAVDEALDRGRFDPVGRLEAPHPFHHFGSRLRRRGQYLQGGKVLRLGIENAKIDKRPADIDADTISHETLREAEKKSEKELGRGRVAGEGGIKAKALILSVLTLSPHSELVEGRWTKGSIPPPPGIHFFRGTTPCTREMG